MNEKKLAIGFIVYGEETRKYLPCFLWSLKHQAFADYKIFVQDNSEEKDNANAAYLKKNFPEIEFEWSSGNIGFGRAHNRMIKKALKEGSKYFLVLNPDTILEPSAIEELVKAMNADNALGSAGPKIFKWGFETNDKTGILDTCGIALKPGLRFIDVGQGEKDDGRYNNAAVIGPSGAAALYRLEALQKVAVKKGGGEEYFDELMFMYKEDCDLAYRLNLAGYKSKCVADAIVYHDRTVYGRGEDSLRVALNRRHKSRRVKKWSFLNQQIIFIKYWHLQNFWNKLAIIQQEIKMCLFILFFEPYLLKQFVILCKLRKEIKAV